MGGCVGHELRGHMSGCVKERKKESVLKQEKKKNDFVGSLENQLSLCFFI